MLCSIDGRCIHALTDIMGLIKFNYCHRISGMSYLSFGNTIIRAIQSISTKEGWQKVTTDRYGQNIINTFFSHQTKMLLREMLSCSWTDEIICVRLLMCRSAGGINGAKDTSLSQVKNKSTTIVHKYTHFIYSVEAPISCTEVLLLLYGPCLTIRRESS